MKAARLESIGNLTLANAEIPDCGPDDLLIKLEACSVCSSDVKMVNYGHRDLKLPVVLGHEIAGTVVEAGKNVKGFKREAKVQVYPGLSCGSCFYCTNGFNNMCDSIEIIGFHLDGGFAEYLHVPKKGILGGVVNRIPDNLSFDEACLAEPTACCINALRQGQLHKGDTVAVFGAGAMGCLLVQVAKALGGSKVFLIEKDAKRLEFAKQFNADYFVDSSHTDYSSIIIEKTGGKGVDVAISACADENIPREGIGILAKKGRIVFFSGIHKEKKDISIDYNLIHYKELNIIGAYGCTSKQNAEALGLISEGIIKAEPLITHNFSLDEIQKALNVVKHREGMKVVINKF